MSLGKRPKLTLGLRKPNPSEDGTSAEGNASNNTAGEERRPKLTLGLKKKVELPEGENGRPKLTLGIKRKTHVFQPHPKESLASTLMEKLTREDIEEALRDVESLRRREFVPNRRLVTRRPVISRRTINPFQKTKGRLEINIKISEIPNWVQTVKKGWQRFCVNADGFVVQMKVRPRIWNKILKASSQYPLWTASITGKMGHRIKGGFELMEPSIQIYEKKPKESTAENSADDNDDSSQSTES
jgi:hypothetical protein